MWESSPLKPSRSRSNWADRSHVWGGLPWQRTALRCLACAAERCRCKLIGGGPSFGKSSVWWKCEGSEPDVHSGRGIATWLKRLKRQRTAMTGAWQSPSLPEGYIYSNSRVCSVILVSLCTPQASATAPMARGLARTGPVGRSASRWAPEASAADCDRFPWGT